MTLITFKTTDGQEFESLEKAENHQNTLLKQKEYQARTIIFSGHSDDIIEVENGSSGIDEFYDGYITLVNGIKGCKIYPKYDGTWSFRVSLIEEDTEFPDDWSFEFKPNTNGYSLDLHVSVTDGTIFRHYR